MRQPNSLEEAVPVRLNTSELRIMALRQQQQIDTQQQLLAAREQRLRFLKAQEACETVALAEGERLRRLRERVEAQESKLRRLRALRGQVDLQKTYNVTLGNDLDSIRALFSEKEKELTLAVAKVEALTRQLEELRRDRRGALNLFPGLSTHSQFSATLPSSIELEKLRGELMYRNQLSLQQDARLHLQREALQKRQVELQSVDQRILELQERLNRKRASNMVPRYQNSSQTTHNNNFCLNHVRSIPSNICSQQKTPRNNIVAVEPFNRVPQKTVALRNNGNKINISNNLTNVNNNTAQPQLGHDYSHDKNRHNHQQSLNECKDILSDSNIKDSSMSAESDESKLAALQKQHENALKNNVNYQSDSHFLTVHSQTIESANILLTKQQFDINPDMINNNNENYDEPNTRNCYYNEKDNKDNNENMKNNETIGNQHSSANECDSDKVSDLTGAPLRTQMTVTVHSTPLSLTNKSVAVPVTTLTSPISEQHTKIMNFYGKAFAYNMLQNIPSGNLVVPPRKPNNITSASKSLSNDIKVISVTPQTQSKNISPTTEYAEMVKPALPPKPNKGNNHVIELDMSYKLPEMNDTSSTKSGNMNNSDNQPIKAKPLTIKKSPQSEQPKLKYSSNNGWVYKAQLPVHRIIETSVMTITAEPDNLDESTPKISQNVSITSNGKSENTEGQGYKHQVQQTADNNITTKKCNESQTEQILDKRIDEISRRKRCFISAVITDGRNKLARRVSFDPLALLLDASLEGELELVQKTALQVSNPSAANDEGITALHNAICAGHVEIVEFLVCFGCDVNAQDSDGWTPLHCAASCNNLSMVKFLVESGACLFAATLSDQETPAEKCEEDEEGFDGCSEYLYSIQEKLGILNNGEVYAVFSYDAQQPDELSFCVNDKLTIIRKGDETEREWWWAREGNGKEGYIPRNLLGFYPRVMPFGDNQIT